MLECPSCGRETVKALVGRARTPPSRWLHVVGLVGMLAELLALVGGAVAAILSGMPNMPLLLGFAGGLLAVLVSLLVWAFLVYLGSGVIEGLRGARSAVAFGPTRRRSNLVDTVFQFVERQARRAHQVLVSAGYVYGSLFLTLGFIAAVIIDIATQFDASDLRIQLFGVALVGTAGALSVPGIVLLTIGLLRPDPLPGDASATVANAVRTARRDRTEVEGVVSAAGPLLRSPVGDEVLAYRVCGQIGGHELDDGDAIPFLLTDDGGRVGRVDADGPVLVALEAEGEPFSSTELAPEFLRERGVDGRGSVTLYRLRPGDRVRVSADFERGASGRTGYREAVAMTLSAGEQPIVIEEPG